MDPLTRPARAWVLDVFVVVVALAFAMPHFTRHEPSPHWVAVLAVLVLDLPLLLRRVWPVPIFLVVFAATIAAGVWDIALAANFALPIALYTVAAYRPRRQALLAAIAVEVGTVAAVLVLHGNKLLLLVLLTGMVTAAVGLGLYSATRRAYVAQLVERAARLEHERDQTNRLAAAAERARIAREMHDIVAHHLTVMVALSDGAGRLVGTDPAQAAEVIGTVSATGRDALRDTRRLLGVLGAPERPGDPDGANALEGPDGASSAPTVGGPDESRSPLPGLADLDALVEQVRSTGLPVDLTVTGTPRQLAAETELAVYRLVQEALTNTLKHAPAGARAGVTIRFSPDAVTLAVTDDGAGTGPVHDWRPGRGLAGMNARVHAVEGDLRSGPRTPSGWRVEARIPLPGAEVMAEVEAEVVAEDGADVGAGDGLGPEATDEGTSA
ncbi:MAG: histidine kinase [Nocardioides sp.]|uniref:sensor histidine kinase n=1 Tax=Nocardioides sp. TaxID=35761 RepID=UPI0039E62E94